MIEKDTNDNATIRSESSIHNKALNNNSNVTIQTAENVTEKGFRNEIEKESSDKDWKDEEPDGGYGWVIVLGSFCVQVISFGVVSSCFSFCTKYFNSGVMQDYFQQNTFQNNDKALLELSFVGTLALIFINGGGPFVHIGLARFGLKPVMIFGSFCIVISLEMAGFSSKVWHLYLTQGVLFGIGSSCMYITVMSITPQWFTKRRGLALGIVAGGSGMGGLLLPLILTPLNRSLGHGWTYRIVGFICLVCNFIACIVIKEKYPKPRSKKKLSEIFQFDVLKNTNFVLFGIGSDIALFGYFVPFFFVPANSSYLGMTDSQGSSFISVMSATNFVGRLLSGYLADYLGPLNSNMIFTLIASLSILFIWNFADSYSSFMGFSAVYGLSSGSYFALMSPITANILGMEKFPSGLSILFALNAFPIFGTNISSVIQSNVNTKPFFVYKMVSGLAFLTGFCILVILRFRLNRKIFTKV